MLCIRTHTLTSPFLLAPMMDITGKAFRDLVRRFGGCGLFYSEMLNSRRVPVERMDSQIFKGFSEEPDLVLQLLGNDPKCLVESIKRLEVFNPFGFDLNLGCSRAAIMQHGWGAALLSDLSLALRAVRAMRQATVKPLTVKLRYIWETPAAAQIFFRQLEQEGVDALIVHPRTTEKIFARPAKWEWIQVAKAAVRIPVIGNGDVMSAEAALEMMRSTGCDGVMLGRGAVAHPTLFREILAIQAKRQPEPRPSASSVFEALVDCFGDDLATPKRMVELKTFCEYFAKGLPVPHWFWGPIQGQRESGKIIALARDFLARNEL